MIGHLGRPRIDWNSDVEPRPKPPNRSWAPAIENQGNMLSMVVMKGHLCESFVEKMNPDLKKVVAS